MSMTKKQIIESLKAMELDYNSSDTRDELQSKLDEALGTSKTPIDIKKVEVKKDAVDANGNRVVEFSELIEYQKMMRNKRLGL
jgi:hypothetical protein